MSIQSREELERWFSNFDPWGYEKSPEDKKRKDILLGEIPPRNYKNVLDIGCGHGFITRDLPGDKIFGVDVSQKVIKQAKKNTKKKKVMYLAASIYDLSELLIKKDKFDLIVITGVLYPQYIGNSHNLIYIIIDQFLLDSGILVSVHIDEWYRAKFPYLMLKQYFYSYREFTHRLEVYIK